MVYFALTQKWPKSDITNQTFGRLIKAGQDMKANLYILAACVAGLFICAACNGWDEMGQPPLLEIFKQGGEYFVITVSAAIAVPLLAIAVMVLMRGRTPLTRAITAIGAYIVCGTALLAYVWFAANGQADSINSAAHMHVIVFPIRHAVFSALVGALALGIIALTSICRYFRQNMSTPKHRLEAAGVPPAPQP